MLAKKTILYSLSIVFSFFLLSFAENGMAGPENAFGGNQGKGVGNTSPGNQGSGPSSAGRAGGISSGGGGNIPGSVSVPNIPATPSIPTPQNLPQAPHVPQTPNVPQGVNQLIEQGFLTIPSSQEEVKQNQDKQKKEKTKLKKNNVPVGPDLDKAINTKNIKEVKGIEKKGGEIILKGGDTDKPSKPDKSTKPSKPSKPEKPTKKPSVTEEPVVTLPHETPPSGDQPTTTTPPEVLPAEPTQPATEQPSSTLPSETQQPVDESSDISETAPSSENAIPSGDNADITVISTGDISSSLLSVIEQDAPLVMQVSLPELPLISDFNNIVIVSIPTIDTFDKVNQIINLKPNKLNCSVLKTPLINAKFNLYQNRTICVKPILMPLAPTTFKSLK